MTNEMGSEEFVAYFKSMSRQLVGDGQAATKTVCRIIGIEN